MLVVGADEVPGDAWVWAMLHWAVKPKTTTSTPPTNRPRKRRMAQITPKKMAE